MQCIVLCKIVYIVAMHPYVDTLQWSVIDHELSDPCTHQISSSKNVCLVTNCEDSRGGRGEEVGDVEGDLGVR